MVFFPFFAALPLTDFHQKLYSSSIYNYQSIAKSPKSLSSFLLELSCRQTNLLTCLLNISNLSFSRDWCYKFLCAFMQMKDNFMTFNMNLNTIARFCFLEAPEQHMRFFLWSIIIYSHVLAVWIWKGVKTDSSSFKVEFWFFR